MSMLTRPGAGFRRRRRGELRFRRRLLRPLRGRASSLRGSASPHRRGTAARRGRRAPLLLALVLVLVGAAAGGWVLRRDAGTPPPLACPPVAPVPAPPPPLAAAEVKVNVYNATDRQGLAKTVADELRSRGFDVAKVANDPRKRTVDAPAELRHGPRAERAAVTVAAQVEGAAPAPDGRKGGTVDLVLGSGWTDLRTPEAAQAALAPPPPAPRPPGC